MGKTYHNHIVIFEKRNNSVWERKQKHLNVLYSSQRPNIAFVICGSHFLNTSFCCQVISNSLWPPWTVACPTPLSSTVSCVLFKSMSVESVVLYNHHVLCHPLLLLPSIFPNISLFQWAESLHQVAKALKLQVQQQSFQWIFRGWPFIHFFLTFINRDSSNHLWIILLYIYIYVLTAQNPFCFVLKKLNSILNYSHYPQDICLILRILGLHKEKVAAKRLYACKWQLGWALVCCTAFSLGKKYYSPCNFLIALIPTTC